MPYSVVCVCGCASEKDCQYYVNLYMVFTLITAFPHLCSAKELGQAAESPFTHITS